MLQVGQSVARGAASVAGAAGEEAKGVAGSVAAAADPALDQMKNELARRVADAANQRAAAPPPAVGTGPREIPQPALHDAATAIAADDRPAAESALVSAGLAAEEARALVEEVANAPRTGDDPVPQLESLLRERLAALPATGAAPGADVRPEEVRQAVDTLDAATLTTLAQHVLRGEREQAKQLLAERTALEDADVEAVLNGLQAQARGAAQEARRGIAETTESASTYAQAALWAAFLSGALALLASIGGGMLGASSARRHVPLRHSAT
jgi:hypothetical protein